MATTKIASYMLARFQKAYSQEYQAIRTWATSTSIWQRYTARAERRKWKKFHLENPTLVEYLKPYRQPSQLVYKLISQGLTISNRKRAEKIIFRENYFRFKAYAIPFFDQATEKFHVGTSFDDLYNLYCADQKLRSFLLPILAQLEVRIRATVDNVVTSTTQDPFWHIDPNNYKNFSNVERGLSKAQQRFKDGKQEFVIHYRNRYFTKKSFKYRKNPPFWIISEIFTLEQLLSVCRALDDQGAVFGHDKLKAIAAPFGLTSYGALTTNLDCILELRNVCAHHTRLWNRNLKNPGGLKGKYRIPPSHPNRLYGHLLMLRILCKAQNIADDIKPFMLSMFTASPIFTRDMANMGFPIDWDKDPIWN